MRAIARLSKLQTVHLDAIVEHPGAARRKGLRDGGPGRRRTVAEQAAAAARAADLGRGGARRRARAP